VFDTALDDGLQPVKPLQASQWLQTAHSLSVWQ
jgi:glycogen operon protein